MTRRTTTRFTHRAAITLAFSFALCASAAQGQLHKDTTRGFQLKAPKDFNSVALNPTEELVIAKWQSDQVEYAGEYGAYNQFYIFHWTSDMNRPDAGPDESLLDFAWKWTDGEVQRTLGFAEVVKTKTLKIGRDKAEERWYMSDDEEQPTCYYACVFEQDDGAYVFFGNALKGTYKKKFAEFSKAVKSFKRIDKDDSAVRMAERSQMSDQEQFLQAQIDKLPTGWDNLRTDRYLFLYNAEKGFVKELSKRIEKMRDVYEDLYPPDRPIEAVSIVRVCNSDDEYFAYGGPQGSGGYWSSLHKELVFFDFRPRDLTLAVLNHEAFHQYIYYYYGELAPHSWYNEGHGDYFAGAKMSRSHSINGYGDAPGGIGRLQTARQAARLAQQGERGGRAATPLKDLMRYSQQEYYANGGKHYAQGWALVHLLREAKGQQPEWKAILPSYLENLLEARHEVAVSTMEKTLENAEKVEQGSSKEMSREPSDYYAAADVGDIQNLAYDKTFADWTDADWDEFNEFYLNYVSKL